MAPEGLRRSSRIPREIAILLVGSDMEGKVFSEKTKTVLLSRHGAGIVSEFKLSAEQELILRRMDTNKEAEVRVVGQIGSQAESYTYGVAFLDPEIDFWGIKFPTLTKSEKEASRLLLECSSCKNREMVQQSDLESDVYMVNEGIVRQCKKCGSSTLWKRATGDAEGEAASLETEQEAETAAPAVKAAEITTEAQKRAAQPENRRKHVRTRANFKACVRSFAFGDDIVACEDISRGGLRFKSRKHYMEKAMVEVSAPYSLGVQNIFVAAQIVHVHELKEEKVFRCGVAYAGSLKNS